VFIIWTSIRPNDIFFKSTISLETVAAQRFFIIHPSTKKKCTCQNFARREIKFGLLRRLRQMNGTRLKLFFADLLARAKKFDTLTLKDFDRDHRYSDARCRRQSERQHFLCDGIDDDAPT
jgi:hypothetical protein